MLVNYHFHDRYSPDAVGTLEENVLQAIEHGVTHFGVTNHAEWGEIMDINEVTKRFSEGKEECDLLKKKYPNFHIMYGYEAGLELMFRKTHEELQDNVKFDFVLGSVHKVNMVEVFEDIERRAYSEVIRDYFDNMIEGLEWGKFTHVSHFDLFKRYASSLFDASWNVEDFRDQLVQIARLIKEKNMVVEINCSGFFCPAKESMPGKDLVKFFVDQGVTKWTLGSDSHKPEDFSKGLKEGLQLLQNFDIKPLAYSSS